MKHEKLGPWKVEFDRLARSARQDFLITGRPRKFRELTFDTELEAQRWRHAFHNWRGAYRKASGQFAAGEPGEYVEFKYPNALTIEIYTRSPNRRAPARPIKITWL